MVFSLFMRLWYAKRKSASGLEGGHSSPFAGVKEDSTWVRRPLMLTELN